MKHKKLIKIIITSALINAACIAALNLHIKHAEKARIRRAEQFESTTDRIADKVARRIISRLKSVKYSKQPSRSVITHQTPIKTVDANAVTSIKTEIADIIAQPIKPANKFINKPVKKTAFKPAKTGGAIVYKYAANADGVSSLYINLTNRCPCDCTFCLRKEYTGVGDADSLWLKNEPAAADVIAKLEQYDLSLFKEIVFCGFGEPFCAYDVMKSVCEQLIAWRNQGLTIPPLRVNTNGLAILTTGGRVVKETANLSVLFDTVSISLNAPSSLEYNEITRPKYKDAFNKMLEFAALCKKGGVNTVFTVVDVMPPAKIAECENLSRSMGIPLRVRKSY